MKLIGKGHIKVALFALWTLVVVTLVLTYLKTGLSPRQAAERLQTGIGLAGMWGPLLYVAVYAFRSLVFFPASLLTVIGGLLFGPWLGLSLTLIGENISANVSFIVGRYFSAGILKYLGSRKQFVPRLTCTLRDNGFLAVLIMRLSYLPFDLVGYSSGMCNIKHRDFALGTLVGTLPGLATFAFLGSSITDPDNLMLTTLFFVVGLTIALVLKKFKHSRNLIPGRW